MQLGNKSIQALGRIVTGDEKLSPYRSGPKLVALFNDFGSDDRYGQGFPSRWSYVEDKLRALNGTKTLPVLIQRILDPREFIDFEKPIDEAITYLNLRFKYDGYEIVKDSLFVKIRDLKGSIVEVANPFEGSDKDVHVFIDEQIAKSEEKLQAGDFDGAITNARALVEAALLDIEKNYDSTAEYDGDLPKLYRKVQKRLDLDPSRPDIDSTLKQVLGGLNSIVAGLAGSRNMMSDAHVRSYKPAKHHALLVVNAARTIVNFLFDVHIVKGKSVDK
ncbi:MAG TPA: abortive infection family protein [Candidatus Wunengus sp. YC60]|uniref:abortive infection family protein n=1 Tax=Candidatus Wunengus sp. YC60 TaxID=3367697 RepID=UPI0040298623